MRKEFLVTSYLAFPFLILTPYGGPLPTPFDTLLQCLAFGRGANNFLSVSIAYI